LIIEVVPARTLFGTVSAATLAAVLDQNIDCVKLLRLDGTVEYMNGNGICAMEIDDFCDVQGQFWADLWPPEARDAILDACEKARDGETSRFSAFCPTAKGKPRWWDVTVSPVRDDDGQLNGFLAISRDITASELSRAALEISTVELRHRLKNTYQIIVSLIASFGQGEPAAEAFATDMAQRIAALGKAQSLFVADDVPCDVGELIPALMAAFGSLRCTVAIDPLGSVLVAPAQADAIALVIGELSVNSAKHGALAHGGSIHIGHRIDDHTLTLLWTEDADRPVENRAREGGQGLDLIQRIVGAREGSISLAWSDHGPRVDMRFDLY
jgi:two-component sensor histidine kinase